jgi:signal transduction histidine kinase
MSLDVNALVRGFEPLIRRAVSESIGIEVAICHEPLVCEVDPSQLETAVLNLAVNSRDAMPRGGALTVMLKQRRSWPQNDAPGRHCLVVFVRPQGSSPMSVGSAFVHLSDQGGTP